MGVYSSPAAGLGIPLRVRWCRLAQSQSEAHADRTFHLSERERDGDTLQLAGPTLSSSSFTQQHSATTNNISQSHKAIFHFIACFNDFSSLIKSF